MDLPSVRLTNFLQLFVHSARYSIQAKFQPILRGYVVSDSEIQENGVLKRRILTPVLFEEDLAKLDKVSYWRIIYDKGRGIYKIERDDQYMIWKAQAGYDDWIFCCLVYCCTCPFLWLVTFVTLILCRVFWTIYVLKISQLEQDSLNVVQWKSGRVLSTCIEQDRLSPLFLMRKKILIVFKGIFPVYKIDIHRFSSFFS